MVTKKLRQKITFTERAVRNDYVSINWENQLQKIVETRYQHDWQDQLPTYENGIHGTTTRSHCSWKNINVVVIKTNNGRPCETIIDKQVAALAMLNHVMKNNKWEHCLELGPCSIKCNCSALSNCGVQTYYASWVEDHWKITDENNKSLSLVGPLFEQSTSIRDEINIVEKEFERSTHDKRITRSHWVNLLHTLIQKRYPRNWQDHLPTYNLTFHGDSSCCWKNINVTIEYINPLAPECNLREKDMKQVAALTILKQVIEEQKWDHCLELNQCRTNCNCLVLPNNTKYYATVTYCTSAGKRLLYFGWELSKTDPSREDDKYRDNWY